PRGLGGAPTDYQVGGEEGAGGQPSLRLLVSVAATAAGGAGLASGLLDAVAGGNGVDRVMGLAWREGRFLGVERRRPLTTSAGKILHVHVEGQPAGSPRRAVQRDDDGALAR